MKNNEVNINDHQSNILKHLANEKQLVDIYLINGIRLQGFINGFDQYTILLTKSLNSSNALDTQVIFKHAVSTIGYSLTK